MNVLAHIHFWRLAAGAVLIISTLFLLISIKDLFQMIPPRQLQKVLRSALKELFQILRDRVRMTVRSAIHPTRAHHLD